MAVVLSFLYNKNIVFWDVLTYPCINPLYAEIFRGNKNIYLYFLLHFISLNSDGEQ